MDFKRIKERLPIKTVLEHYNMFEGMRESGKRIRGACPIHRGNNPTAFSVNKEKNIFYCFKCKKGGSVLAVLPIL